MSVSLSDDRYGVSKNTAKKSAPYCEIHLYLKLLKNQNLGIETGHAVTVLGRIQRSNVKGLAANAGLGVKLPVPLVGIT